MTVVFAAQRAARRPLGGAAPGLAAQRSGPLARLVLAVLCAGVWVAPGVDPGALAAAAARAPTSRPPALAAQPAETPAIWIEAALRQATDPQSADPRATDPQSAGPGAAVPGAGSPRSAGPQQLAPGPARGGPAAPPRSIAAAGTPAVGADDLLLEAERARLRQEAEGRPRPRAERDARRAAEQILALLEADAPALAAFQARAYLGLEEPLLAPPAQPVQSPGASEPSAAPGASGASGAPAAPGSPGTSGAPDPALEGLPARPAALDLSASERALLELLRAACLWERLEQRWQAPAASPGSAAAGDALAAALEAEAATALEAAGLAAGPGDLRLRAFYNLGTLRLLSAEQAFLALAGERLLAGDQAPDPAALRPRYEAIAAALRTARAPLLARLALDWRDRSTRANLEWLQRRLEEVQRALEELPEPAQQPQPSEQPPPESEQPPEQDPQQQPEPDPEQQGDTGDQPPPEDGDPQSGEQRPEDGAPPEQDPGEQSAEPQGEQPPEQGADEQSPGSAEESPQAGGEADERALTETEIQRLLDRLEQYERLREELRARRRAQRRGVERDW